MLIIKRKDYLFISNLWGDIAASNGNANGDGLRDVVAIKMTSSQIEKAQNSPVNAFERNTKGC